MRNMDEREAKYVVVLSSVGLAKNIIARKFNYKYMDVNKAIFLTKKFIYSSFL